MLPVEQSEAHEQEDYDIRDEADEREYEGSSGRLAGSHFVEEPRALLAILRQGHHV